MSEGSSQEVAANILVVDDDPINQDLMEAVLSPPHRAIKAWSGARALEQLKANAIDLVLLDVTMPGMNGFDVCRHIKASKPDPFLPVILLTAQAYGSARRSGTEAGADDFCAKPFDSRALRERIQVFLRLRKEDVTLRLLQEELDRGQHHQTLVRVAELLQRARARTGDMESILSETSAAVQAQIESARATLSGA